VDKLFENLPAIISAAAQSQLGILALLSVALSVLAYFFFAGASEKVKVGIFVLLFLGVAGFAAAMFRSAATASEPAQTGMTTESAHQLSADPLASLSEEAKRLLKEAALDPAGTVVFFRYGGGVDLETNGKSFIADQSHRGVATWESALQELVDSELLIARGTSWEIFEVSKKGYDAAERLPLAAS
jgi:hypothetical protein